MLSFLQKTLHFLLFHFIIFSVNERVHYFRNTFFVYFCKIFDFFNTLSRQSDNDRNSKNRESFLINSKFCKFERAYIYYVN